MKGTELMNMWLLFTMAAHHSSECGRGLCYDIHMNLSGIELHIAVKNSRFDHEGLCHLQA